MIVDTNDDSRYLEVHLGYFKQGDDLAHCLEQCKNNPVESFKMHASLLRSVAEHLDDVAAVLVKANPNDIQINADVHHISVTVPSLIADELLEKELAAVDPFEEEMEEDEDCDDEEMEEDDDEDDEDD